MASILKYGSYDDVRVLLGVDKFELPDEDMDSEVLFSRLSLDLSAVTGALPGDTAERDLEEWFDYLHGLQNKSKDQQRLQALISVYAVARFAWYIATTLSIRVPKEETDGKATQTRFSSESAYLKVIQSIADTSDAYLLRIRESFGQYSSGSGFVGLSAASPSVDVVTGRSS